MNAEVLGHTEQNRLPSLNTKQDRTVYDSDAFPLWQYVTEEFNYTNHIKTRSGNLANLKGAN